MLDIMLVREQPELFKANEQKRNRNPAHVGQVLKLDEQWRKTLKEVEELKHCRNVVSQEINLLKKQGNYGQKESEGKIEQMRKVAAEIKQKEEVAEALHHERQEALLQLGNIMHPNVPFGKDDSENKEIKHKGRIPKFSFPVKSHVELLEHLGLVDFEASAKLAGNGFYILKDELGLLNQALIRFASSVMRKKGYTYIEPPLLVRQKIIAAAVDLPEIQKSIYSVIDDDLSLIGTSEHALLGLHSGEALLEQEFPKKYYSYSMCFRKEVGAHGINEKGLWRTHQFNKVEQFIFCAPEESAKYFNELLKNSEDILQALGLPYRVIEICSGDLAVWKHRSYDLEVWRPTTQSYGEVMSLSNCTDYQARKLDIKMVGKDGKRRVVHTLNNTALATSRILVGIVENFQTKKGTVKIPKALWPYMDGVKELKGSELDRSASKKKRI